VEQKQHLNTHKYHIIQKLDFSLLNPSWKAYEELLLFEGLEKYGFGNWKDISMHVGF